MRLRRSVSRTCAMLLFVLIGCGDDGLLARWMGKQPPLELPVLETTDLPFRYPPGLFIERIQGDVVLRLYIDSLGRVVTDSTRVAEASKYAPFDSAAIEGAAKLSFHPAKRGTHRIPYAVLFPVKFRLPAAAATPADTSRPPAKP
ncbi:MAG: energy transducer TonB [Gemmatimonadaceae bacterium]